MGGRAGVRYVTTKFSRMDSLPNFLTHDALLRALRARGAPLSNLNITEKTKLILILVVKQRHRANGR